jgi:hypothetical protein
VTPTTIKRSCYKSNFTKTKIISSLADPQSTEQAEDEYDTMPESKKSRSSVKRKRGQQSSSSSSSISK